MNTFHALNCTHTILNVPILVDARSPFQHDCPPSLLELTT